MTPEAQRWHMEVISSHNHTMYETLIHPHHVVSENLKEIEFDDRAPVRGYFAKKNKAKYWIDETILDLLPIRLGDRNEELIWKDDVVIRPLNPRPFKIVPIHKFSAKQLIDGMLPFQHSNPMHWKLLKIMAIMGYVGRTYICIASNSNFGKSSAFDVIHGITDKSPVFKPRSVPGVLNQINGTGNIVLDETHKCEKVVRDIIEEFALQIGGGKSVYINGAMKSNATKEKYDCRNQSITFLYNIITNYANPLKEYFDYIFSNNVAIDTRFLKVRLDGELTEKFDRDFDIAGTAEANRGYYIDLAKELAWLQEAKINNLYKRRYARTKALMHLKGRRRLIFDELTWLIDMYSDSSEEYNLIVEELEKCISRYTEMLSVLKDDIRLEVKEEIV